MSSVKEIEEHGEVVEASGSKDCKGSMKSLFDKEDPSVKLEIKNPEYVDLGNHVKTSKSAADAIAALVAQMKKMRYLYLKLIEKYKKMRKFALFTVMLIIGMMVEIT
jgi:hypothetical protein